MKRYKENDLVIYQDSNGALIDTFVIFDTDRSTGLTHINHQNLKVRSYLLKLHPAAKEQALPMADRYSFELFKQLKEKYDAGKTLLKKWKTKRFLAKMRR